MTSSHSFPSLHDCVYEHQGRKCSLYEIGALLSNSRLSQIALALQSKGFPIEKLEFYEYGKADSLRHLFIKMKDKKKSIPYFQLDIVFWNAIIEEILG